MQELNTTHIDDVSGGLSLVQALLGWGVSRFMDAAVAGIASYAANGGAPDYANTTAMGDMY